MLTEYEQLKWQFTSTEPPRSLFPLLWLHGGEDETEEVLRREIAAMDKGGSGGFIIESRPHDDYLGDRWWRDVRICLDEAERRNMEVWIFDEEFFPSGIAGGKVLAENPDFRMKVLVKDSFRWNGEASTALPKVDDFHTVIKVVCVPSGRISERLRFASLTEARQWMLEQSARASSGEWDIHIIGLKPSSSGRMFEKMVDYLCPDITDRFIAITYERTKEELLPYWGKTIKGFFGDETSFENFASYDVLFGEDTPSFPWSRVLPDAFIEDKGYDLTDKIELLWLDSGESETTVRFDFMDQLTKLFSENFFGRIQSWCHRNGVRFIGHVVEDNHAHMHHGYGVGHFFRSTRRFDMGGYDIVLRQVDSDQKQSDEEEHYPQFKTYRDRPYPDFYHFTLAKLAQSAAHLELGTDLVMCESFGAYGWDLGLKEMKWLTDWMTARGTNWIVPHAFSPKFPDPDCPPHFFAGGRNPQWPFYRMWANYANRCCLMLRGGRHIAPIAVLYPAESHWSGDLDTLDGVCRTLMEHQYDFDILSMDLLVDASRCVLADGMLRIGSETFHTVILPGIETIPFEALERLAEFTQSGGRLIQAGSAVNKECRGNHARVASLMTDMAVNTVTVSMERLGEYLLSSVPRGLSTERIFHDLRYCHFKKDGMDIFFLNNESVECTFEDRVTFPAAGYPEFWQPMGGRIDRVAAFSSENGTTTLPVRLEPYQAVFIVFRHNAGGSEEIVTAPAQSAVLPVGSNPATQTIDLVDWKIVSANSPLQGITDSAGAQLTGLGNWHLVPGWEAFTGTVVYRTAFDLNVTDNGTYVLDLGDVGEIASVILNGVALEPSICPPYRWTLPLHLLRSDNHLEVAVTNTLGAYFLEDEFRRNVPAPSGLLGPVRLIGITAMGA